MHKFNTLILTSLVGLLVAVACNNRKAGGKELDTPISGEISIAVDESFQPLLEAEIGTFEGLYTQARIHARYLPEGKAIQELLNDSVRMAVVSRPLTEKEKQFIESQKFYIHSTRIAVDAVALIVNNQNPDTVLSYEQVVDVIQGKVNQWRQINPDSKLGVLKVIFDNSNSSTVRYLKDSIGKVQQLPANCFAVDNNPKVVEYVSTDKQAIGVIGVGWISDKDDTLTRGFLKQVKTIGLARPKANLLNAEYFQPYQAYIAQKSYPLTREIYIISREARSGLGSGFTSFVASDKGQRIVLKAGLLPATMPLRVMEFSKRDLSQ